MRVTGQHWTVAFSVAVLAHAGVAAAVLWQSPPSGAQSAGLGGIEVSLGPTGGAPGTVAAPAPLPPVEPEADSIEPPEAAVQPPPEETAAVPPEPERADLAEASAVAEPVALPVEVPEMLAETAEPLVPEPVEEARPVEVEPAAVTPAEAVAAALPEAEPEPPPLPPTPQPKPLVPAVAEATPTPRAEPAPPPKAADIVALPDVQIATSVPAVQGAGGKAGSQDSPEAGSADQVTGGGLPGQATDYMSLLQAWLHKHKEYPRRAQARRQEGTALLYFVMDRDGRVSDSHIQRSSGYQLLDEEVLALIRRAEPLPPPPPELAGDNIKLVVPVQFFLR